MCIHYYFLWPVINITVVISSTATNFNITENGDFCINVKNWYQNNKTGHDIKLPVVAVISKYIVMVLAVLNLVREVGTC